MPCCETMSNVSGQPCSVCTPPSVKPLGTTTEPSPPEGCCGVLGVGVPGVDGIGVDGIGVDGIGVDGIGVDGIGVVGVRVGGVMGGGVFVGVLLPLCTAANTITAPAM